jgi:stage III sporulation protein AD
MDVTALAAVGVAAALCALVVRQRSPEVAMCLSLAGCVLLLWRVLPALETIRDVLQELADLAQLTPAVLKPMVQTVGIALVTKLASSLCRDSGEGSLAAFLEVAGSVSAVVVALPLLEMVLQLVMDLL